jgi:hypothetical protein
VTKQDPCLSRSFWKKSDLTRSRKASSNCDQPTHHPCCASSCLAFPTERPPPKHLCLRFASKNCLGKLLLDQDFSVTCPIREQYEGLIFRSIRVVNPYDLAAYASENWLTVRPDTCVSNCVDTTPDSIESQETEAVRSTHSGSHWLEKQHADSLADRLIFLRWPTLFQNVGAVPRERPC